MNNNTLSTILAIAFTAIAILYFFELKNSKSNSELLIEAHKEETKTARKLISYQDSVIDASQKKIIQKADSLRIRTKQNDSLTDVLKKKDVIIWNQRKEIDEIKNRFSDMSKEELHDWLQEFLNTE